MCKFGDAAYGRRIEAAAERRHGLLGVFRVCSAWTVMTVEICKIV